MSTTLPSPKPSGFEALRKPRVRRDMFAGLAMLAPSGIVLLVFVIIPVIMAFYLSFTSWEARSTDGAFIGIENYVNLLTGKELWNAVKNTALFSVIKISLDVVLSLSIALLLNQRLRGIGIFRTIYFLPVVTSVVAVGAVWRVIYNPRFGLLNSFLEMLGFAGQTWLSDPALALPSVTMVALWKGLGYDVVIFLAGLQGISQVYYEAAKIDGANSWQRFRYVTWPMLSPITFFVVVMGIINSFKVFSLIHVMTPDGGPLNSTEVMVVYLYRLAFEEFKFGKAAAVAFILFAIVLLITFIQRRLIEPRVHY